MMLVTPGILGNLEFGIFFRGPGKLGKADNFPVLLENHNFPVLLESPGILWKNFISFINKPAEVSDS